MLKINSMAPIHILQNMIDQGQYVSPLQAWYEIKDKVPRIYTKQIVMDLAKELNN